MGGRYPKYVLCVLVVVYVFNQVDRNVLSILAEEIKGDLGISDAEMGFLFGTAFAVFFSVFGIPLARLADVWTRKSLIALGLAFWSVMTALSGTVSSFAALAVLRFGVGAGEASATPAAYSLLSDYFAPRVRATVLAVYSSGGLLGIGLGLIIGGVFIDFWNERFGEDPPFGLDAWRAAFIAVGLPGLLMAIWVWSLREPERGISEGFTQEIHPRPFQIVYRELMTIVPPFTLLEAARRGILARNLIALVILGAAAWGLTATLGSPAQWTALGLGVYAATSWVQVLGHRDPATFAMIFRSRTFVTSVIGFAMMGFPGYAVGFWMAPYLLRTHGVGEAEAGTLLGLATMVGGVVGMPFWGWASDRLRSRTPRGRLYIAILIALGAPPIVILILNTSSLPVIYIAFCVFHMFSSGHAGPAASTVTDLVMPRMRATASAFYILVFTFVGGALGPYVVGLLSDRMIADGLDPGESLRRALLGSLPLYAFVVAFLFLASRSIERDEDSRLERARDAGEDV